MAAALLGALSASAAFSPFPAPGSPTNAYRTSAPTNLTSSATNAIESLYQKLLAADDAAQEEVDGWIQDNNAFAGQGAGISQADLNRRIRERLAPVRGGYEAFIRQNPNHAKARIAFGSFLGDLGEEEEARAQWETALELDPKNPAIYNNLANVYSHRGPIAKAFDFLQKAIELNPREPVYYHNLGTMVYLFRSEAQEHYKIDQNQVFARTFQLYSNAMRLDPGNFPLASDVAQTYYGITPMRTQDALRAWTNALAVARDQIERDGVSLHLARIKMMDGRFGEARNHIEAVTNSIYTDLKARLAGNLREKVAASLTNAAAPGSP